MQNSVVFRFASTYIGRVCVGCVLPYSSFQFHCLSDGSFFFWIIVIFFCYSEIPFSSHLFHILSSTRTADPTRDNVPLLIFYLLHLCKKFRVLYSCSSFVCSDEMSLARANIANYFTDKYWEVSLKSLQFCHTALLYDKARYQ